jgi:RNA polymerase sigma-70 factor, ECF subfamily
MPPPSESDQIESLLEQARRGESLDPTALFDSQGASLLLFVAARLDRRLAARVDPADVVQEVLFEATQRLPDFLANRPVPVDQWLRQIAVNHLNTVHRRHIQAKKRSVKREVLQPPHTGEPPFNWLISAAPSLEKSPSSMVGNVEMQQHVRRLVSRLEARDQEILQLRFVDQRSIREIAEHLELSEDGVRLRQLFALKRLRELLDLPREAEP